MAEISSMWSLPLLIRRPASDALLAAGEALAPEIISRITTDLIISRTAVVAANLVLLLAWRGEMNVIEESGKMLATNAGRRVFVLLLIWLVKDRDVALAARLTAMLPTGHPSLQWALGGDSDQNAATMLDDLGEPEAVAEVLRYFIPSK